MPRFWLYRKPKPRNALLSRCQPRTRFGNDTDLESTTLPSKAETLKYRGVQRNAKLQHSPGAKLNWQLRAWGVSSNWTHGPKAQIQINIRWQHPQFRLSFPRVIRQRTKWTEAPLALHESLLYTKPRQGPVTALSKSNAAAGVCRVDPEPGRGKGGGKGACVSATGTVLRWLAFT